MQVPSIRTLLMNLEHLKTCAVRCEVAYMDSVTMTVSCSIQQRAVIINGARAIEYLILTVAVNIRYRKVMVTVAIESGRAATRCALSALGVELAPSRYATHAR